MKFTELNPAGNFKPWETSKVEELKCIDTHQPLGNNLLFEDKSIRLWNISLEPSERLPFRLQQTNYNWICLTGGLAISRYSDGKICLLKFEKEDTDYWVFEKSPIITDFENIGEELLFINILEYKPKDKHPIFKRNF